MDFLLVSKYFLTTYIACFTDRLFKYDVKFPVYEVAVDLWSNIIAMDYPCMGCVEMDSAWQ